MSNSIDDTYDLILDQIGHHGRFQKTFNYIFNLGFATAASMAAFNHYLLLAVPDHLCRPPDDQYTAEECFLNFNGSKTTCTVWDYDKTWYKETLPSKANWVCDEFSKVNYAYVFSRIGEILGTLIFGQIGDRFGRRPVFYSTALLLLIGRIMMIYTIHYFPLFAFAVLIGNLSGGTFLQGPLVIGIEITKDKGRSLISLFQCVGWTLGISILPLIYWAFGHWYPYALITSLPLIPFLLFWNYMIESPRWLINNGKLKEGFKQLKKIAKMNKKSISFSIFEKMEIPEKNKTNDFGIFSLFTNRILLKNTVLVIVGWITYINVYSVLNINLTNLKGNPFLNMFLQSLAELPGYILGKFVTDKIGRKPVRIFSFFATLAGNCVIIIFVNDPSYASLVLWCSVFLKFTTSLMFFVCNLHAIEIYPTNLRQTGSTVGWFFGNIFGLTVPYFIYFGKTIDPRIPYIAAAVVSLSGGIGSFFLPETKGKKLPETVEDVRKLYADKSFDYDVVKT